MPARSKASQLLFAAGSREFERDTVEAKAFKQLSDSLSGTSRSLRDKSLSEMLDGLNAFARNNPAAFIGGAVALGFAASRFAVASGSSPADGDDTAHDKPATARPTATPPQPAGGAPEVKTREATS
ncbi:hypothetical protein QW131_28930 [Roseibium salinum]|nr:hypothetical protein [Roseibium salinum]